MSPKPKFSLDFEEVKVGTGSTIEEIISACKEHPGFSNDRTFAIATLKRLLACGGCEKTTKTNLKLLSGLLTEEGLKTIQDKVLVP